MTKTQVAKPDRLLGRDHIFLPYISSIEIDDKQCSRNT